MENNTIIKPRDYILIQRQDYMKLYKMKNNNNIVQLTNHFRVNIDRVLEHRYHDCFQMVAAGNKLYKLEKRIEIPAMTEIRDELGSGTDNRNIIDDGLSQTLNKDDIERLRDESTNSSKDIVTQLINNSKTYAQKTEFSQEKYVKKKSKKHFDFITIRKPTIRLLANTFYKKTQHMRIDDLSMILTHANVQSDGNYLVYDGGSNGLIPAAILNAIGRRNGGRLIYVHPGNENQKTCVEAMMFDEEHLKRMVNVNIYSVLRWYHQKFEKEELETNNKPQALEKIETDKEEEPLAKKSKTEEKEEEPPAKRLKTENSADDKDDKEEKPKAIPIWHKQNQFACEILKSGLEGLIVSSKECPLTIVNEFIPFLKPSRSLVVYHALIEPLKELYQHLAHRPDFINVQLSGNFMRNYQVLPERTHPLVNMDYGGFLLTAQKVST